MTTISTHYREFRKASPFMLVGHNAEQAISSARTLTDWERLLSEGRVKIEVTPDDDPDPSFYDTWDLSERSREQLKSDYYRDCWIVSTYYICPHCEEWKMADSIGGCSGYVDPCSPLENAYVIDLMDEAITELECSDGPLIQDYREDFGADM